MMGSGWGQREAGQASVVFSDHNNPLGSLSTFCEVKRNTEMQDRKNSS